MQTLVPGTALNDEYWADYLVTPQSSLFGRAYDAIGFYGHLEYVGVDVWSVLLPMMTASSNETAFTLAAGGGAGTTTDWPSGFFRGAVPGKPWNTSGPDITNDKPPVPALTVANGGTQEGTVAPATNDLATVDLQADFVLVDVLGDGHLRDADGDDTVIQGVHGGLYCTLPEPECVCPDGTPNAGRELGEGRIAKGEARLAVSGALPGGSWELTGQSLQQVTKQLCDQKCTVGRFTSTSFSIDLPAGIAVSGGTGATLVIQQDGSFFLDYTPMSAATISGPGFSGSVTIKGTGTGTLEFTTAATASPGVVEAGTVTGTGTSDALINGSTPVGSGSFTGPLLLPGRHRFRAHRAGDRPLRRSLAVAAGRARHRDRATRVAVRVGATGSSRAASLLV